MSTVNLENRFVNSLSCFGYWFTDTIVRYSSIILSIIILFPLVGVGLELLLRTSGFIAGANLLKSVYSVNCHQIEARCPVVLGSHLIICYRCLGFYSGAVIGLMLTLAPRINIGKIVPLIVISLGLNFIDIIGIGLNLWDWPGSARFLIAFPAGLAPVYFLMKGMFKITRDYRK
ncbi:MAG: DUF2085 domain-containing protein [candidate division Zixibacteria bacterium]|nr:DUF2085 domain-containing protein [candidate division Zixibacteria bacterium]